MNCLKCKDNQLKFISNELDLVGKWKCKSCGHQ